jgi:hypothetical protein
LVFDDVVGETDRCCKMVGEKQFLDYGCLITPLLSQLSADFIFGNTQGFGTENNR